MNCKADSTDETKAICRTYIYNEGEYYLTVNGTEFKNLTVTSKKLPLLNYYSPISIIPSLNSQTIILSFEEDISSYVNKITFVGAETLHPTCELISKYVLFCIAVFDKEDKYYISFDGYQTEKYINVNELDNKMVEDNNEIKDEEGNNSDDDGDQGGQGEGVDYLKMSSLLFSLLLLF